MNDVLAQLTTEGLMKTPAPDPSAVIGARMSSSLPWFVKIFVGISAWIAAILITAFLFLIGLIDIQQSLLLGIVFCGIAIAISRLPKTNTFFEQLALALSLTGQVLAIVGFFELFDETLAPVTIAVFILEALLIWLHRDSVLRFISTLVITVFIIVLIWDEGILEILHVFILALTAGILLINIMENQLDVLGFSEISGPVGSALTVALMGILTIPQWDEFHIDWWITAVIQACFLMFLLGWIFNDLGHKVTDPLVLILSAGCLLLLVPALRMPGILTALLILVLGFWRSNRWLMGLASVFLVYYISYYYYSLELTLLTKSIILMGSGLILLLVRWMLVELGRGRGVQK
jgi:uncharacterized membrane protein